MIIAFQILGGLLLLFIGGEVLVRGSVSMAKKLGISPFVIGLTIVAYGTSSPELIISVQAAFDGHPDIALGNIVGSNIANILCVLGITALIYPIAIDKKLSSLDGLYMVGVTVLLYVLCFMFGEIGLISGIIFVTVLCVYTVMVFIKAKQTKDVLPEEMTEEVEEQLKIKLNLPQSILACIAGLALLALGADIMIKGSVSLALMFGVPEAVVGLSLVAFGTSVPELVTSVVAALHKKSEIVFGNIIGSNLFNILGILGITGTIKPINVSERFLFVDMALMLAVTVLLFAIISLFPKISRPLGGVMFVSYLAYIGFLYI